MGQSLFSWCSLSPSDLTRFPLWREKEKAIVGCFEGGIKTDSFYSACASREWGLASNSGPPPLSFLADRHHGTPMLLEGVKCIGAELEYDSEQSEWHGFD